ncbi:hypothetical protein [uncultured Maribacter sp.]|uniref:hypothetical protein n=1 Tax=uncultured Maribacter sp. TaxID=431308 RepID=UPI0030DB4A15|tara:strand:+ start:245 stop:1006 length:762 start_codon:yes stop_codon:yes gene_type:complete
MIKFFRKIRLNLLSEGKTVNYLKYAIGEIILVMIGILLALQVNNWNENRKQLIAEQKILISLQKELETNKNNLSFYIKKYEKQYENGVYLLSLFSKYSDTTPTLTLDKALGSIEETYTFEASDGIINSIIASGQIDIIQNTELKSMITSFNGAVINATQEVENVTLLLHNRLWPTIEGKINSANRSRTYEGFTDFPKGSYPSDYTWFFKSKEIEDIIGNITSWHKTIYTDQNNLMQIIDKMLLMTKQEINANE